MGEAIDGPVWLDVWANVQVAVILVPLIVYSIMKYSHTSGPQFGKFLSALNLAAAVLSLILQVIVVIDPRACAFFFHETIFSMADFSLYHFRTAIFYQSNVRFYRILKWVFNVQNACFAILVIGNALTNSHVSSTGFSCGGTYGAPLLAVVLPTYIIFVFMLSLGYYTVWKYWSNASEDARKNMRGLWVMLLAYTVTNVAVFVSSLCAYFGTSPVAIFCVYIVDKTVAIVLAALVWWRTHQREATKSKGFSNATSASPSPVKTRLGQMSTAVSKSVPHGSIKVVPASQ
ncbi:THH1/TOM1/TOM3 domain-containing protein [Plasmodiophora brassicae]